MNKNSKSINEPYQKKIACPFNVGIQSPREAERGERDLVLDLLGLVILTKNNVNIENCRGFALKVLSP